MVWENNLVTLQGEPLKGIGLPCVRPGLLNNFFGKIIWKRGTNGVGLLTLYVPYHLFIPIFLPSVEDKAPGILISRQGFSGCGQKLYADEYAEDNSQDCRQR